MRTLFAGNFQENEADIVCGECDAVIRTVPIGDLDRVITDMELSLRMLALRQPQQSGAPNLA